MVIFTALLSASKARRSDIISAVAPPSFCSGITLRLMKIRDAKTVTREYIYVVDNKVPQTLHLTKSVEVFKVCLIKSVPHYFNVHIIQVLQT